MQELNLRLGQAVALTYAQTDENFKRLKTAIDALEVAVAGAGLGTVTSVGLTLPNIFTVTNSPVTTTGSLTATLASQSANRLFASPDGSAGTPTFRSLVAADLGVITVPVTNGGTGLAAPIPNNFVLSSNGSAYQGREILPTGGLTAVFAPASITLGLDPALINITGFAGTLTSAKGGTGFTGPFAVNQILLGNGSSSWTSPVLTAGSGISITNGVGTVTISNTATGVSTLNYLTGNLLMAFGTAGNSPVINTAGSVITFDIPDAGPLPVTRGLLTTADWTTFNNKVSSTGTANYVPRFTSANVIQNGIMYDTGARIGINTVTPTYDLDIQQFAGGSADTTLRVRTTATSYHSNLRLETSTGAALTLSSTGRIQYPGGDITFQSSLIGPTFFNNGNVIFRRGIAFGQYAYHNAAANYAFIDNTYYGVILGPASGVANTITLPTSPMEGQEVAVLTEINKTNISFAAGGTPIFGHNGGSGIAMTISGGGAKGSAVILAKYSIANLSGAWYVSVSE